MQPRFGVMSFDSPTRPRPSWRALLLPREHGSWSLAIEPLVLALIAAPSGAGTALAIGAMALFFARRPWQAARAGDTRLRPALTALLGLGSMAVIFFALAMHHAAAPILPAVLLGLPAGAAFAWFDRRKAGREMAAELCGAAFFAAFAAAIALAAGRAMDLAIVFAGFVLARSWTSILAIRTFLRRRKGAQTRRSPAMLVAIAAVFAFGMHASAAGVWVPFAWTAVFFARTSTLLFSREPKWTARQIGTTEAILGVLVAVTTGLALR